MNAVATITPDPKYFAIKNVHDGKPAPLCLEAKTGNHAPKSEPTRMTKTDDILSPILPL